MPAAKLVGKLALGIGLVFVRSRPHPLAPHLRRALDRVSIQSGQRAAQLVEFDPFEHFIVVEQQFDLTRRVRIDRAFVRSFELELICSECAVGVIASRRGDVRLPATNGQ